MKYSHWPLSRCVRLASGGGADIQIILVNINRILFRLILQIASSFITEIQHSWAYLLHKPLMFSGEWMVWNSLILVTLPSTLSSLSSGHDLVILAGLLSISYIMWVITPQHTFIMSQVNMSVSRYLCLVHYTGAVPAEFYSIKSRPGYKSYQQRVNMFIPGPRRQEGGMKRWIILKSK